jgi:hypothetical protein
MTTGTHQAAAFTDEHGAFILRRKDSVRPGVLRVSVVASDRQL